MFWIFRNKNKQKKPSASKRCCNGQAAMDRHPIAQSALPRVGEKAPPICFMSNPGGRNFGIHVSPEHRSLTLANKKEGGTFFRLGRTAGWPSTLNVPHLSSAIYVCAGKQNLVTRRAVSRETPPEVHFQLILWKRFSNAPFAGMRENKAHIFFQNVKSFPPFCIQKPNLPRVVIFLNALCACFSPTRCAGCFDGHCF